MKSKIILFCILAAFLSANVLAQKQSAAAATVSEFYRFHFAHRDIFNEREVSRRQRFFTPKLRRLFSAELRRQTLYLKKYPDNKPYFEGLPFQPIELCENDYKIGKAQIRGQNAAVPVNFIYSKSSCTANDGVKLIYKISLVKIGGKWLIDDVVYDDGTTLGQAFNEAKKIK